MRHTLFISDLHLEPGRPDITQCFLDFLNNTAPQADALYILGDFFEVWIGDDETSVFHRLVIAALKQATNNGLKIYLMHGNRDFLMGDDFLYASGCHFLPDPTVLELYANPVVLTHGDALCAADIQHQKFRKYTQNRRYKRAFLCLPLFMRRAVARLIRRASQKHSGKAPAPIMDVAQWAVEQQMRQQHVRQLIHGHTHRPAIHNFILDGEPARRAVLSDWHSQGGVLQYAENGEITLIPLPFNNATA